MSICPILVKNAYIFTQLEHGLQHGLEFHVYGNTYLKGQLCKLHNNKYIITSTKITNTEIFASFEIY